MSGLIDPPVRFFTHHSSFIIRHSTTYPRAKTGHSPQFLISRGTPKTMKRLVGWVERSATHQVFSRQRRRGHREFIFAHWQRHNSPLPASCFPLLASRFSLPAPRSPLPPSVLSPQSSVLLLAPRSLLPAPCFPLPPSVLSPQSSVLLLASCSPLPASRL